MVERYNSHLEVQCIGVRRAERSDDFDKQPGVVAVPVAGCTMIKIDPDTTGNWQVALAMAAYGEDYIAFLDYLRDPYGGSDRIAPSFVKLGMIR